MRSHVLLALLLIPASAAAQTTATTPAPVPAVPPMEQNGARVPEQIAPPAKGAGVIGAPNAAPFSAGPSADPPLNGSGDAVPILTK
jgi:hypothetical protein